MTDNTERNPRGAIGFEYKKINVDVDSASFLIDSYGSFGWEPDENMAAVCREARTTIRLKRSRKLINRTELTRLQRNFEACVSELEQLEKSKTATATVLSLVIGIVGTVFMAGSVFAVTADPPRIAICILLAAPALVCWAAPYFVYKKAVKKRTEKITPVIEEKYEEIYTICEKGSRLLL